MSVKEIAMESEGSVAKAGGSLLIAGQHQLLEVIHHEYH
jgi:hypothetical protein